MTKEHSLEKRFNKHPELGLNSKTSLDDEFISLIISKPDLDGLIEKDVDNSGDPSSIYSDIISKLGLLEFLDIKTLLTDYLSSNFWISLGSEKQLEFIERTLEICEEKEQNALESIGVEKAEIRSEKAAQGKPKKINVPFDVVADRILDEFHILTMRDNQQLYVYKDGVFRSEGAEAILDTEIRNSHNKISIDHWNRYNPDFPIEHIPKATIRFVREVLAHIRAYTHIARGSIEKVQSKYINFKNGLFNLETWETEDHSPEIKSICQIPVIFDKDAKCPKISEFLRSVVAEPDINLLCEMAGYCLTTDCSQQKAFMLYGVGSNGKSVFLALLESLIGKENTSAESLQKLEFDKYRPVKLFGKRINICGDIPDIKMQKSENFKKLTSGFDLIDGENKYQDPFTFKNTAKLVFSANDIPEGKKDKAYYRRWILIRFPNNFEGENADKSLSTKLQTSEELSGFLNLALDGLKRVQKNEKFSNEKSIEATQKEYELNSNPIAAFMEECTQISDEDCEGVILYLEYVDWCNSCGKDHISNIGFSRKLKSLGYDSHRENVRDNNSFSKMTLWDNLKIKRDRIGQNTKMPKIYLVLV
jgi:putative DNA primase/helicase